MSDRAPEPADLEALRSAVRPLRLAAAELGRPWGTLPLAVAAAELLPALLDPELELVSFSPFGALAGVPGPAGAEPAARRAGGGRRAPGASGGPAPGAPREAARGRAQGRRVFEERLISGETAPAGAEPAPAAAPTGRAAGAAAAADRSAAEAAPEAEAPRGPAAGPTAASGQAPAHGPPSGDAPGPFDLLGSLVDVVESVARHADGGSGLRKVAPGSPASRPSPAAPATPRDPATARAQRRRAFEELTSSAGEDASVPVAAAASLLGGAKPAAAEQAQGGAAPLDRFRRVLLATPFDAPASAASPSAQVVAAAPAAAAVRAVKLAGTESALLGLRAATEPAQLEPGELAWLVNEALIEQARLHGIDLT